MDQMTTQEELSADEALRPANRLMLAHDGSHWTGTFQRVLRAGLGIELEDGPLTNVSVIVEPRPGHFMRYCGTVTQLSDEAVVFEDGVTARLDQLLSVGY